MLRSSCGMKMKWMRYEDEVDDDIVIEDDAEPDKYNRFSRHDYNMIAA